MALPEYPLWTGAQGCNQMRYSKLHQRGLQPGVRYMGRCCGFEPYHIGATAEELAPERGLWPPASDKHGSWGSGLNFHTNP